MTEKQIQQVNDQLPKDEKLSRMYAAFEGGIRVISKDKNGTERRYEVVFDTDDNVSIKPM